MSIILKPSALKVKDDNGNYIGTNMFAAESTQEYLDAITTIGTQTQTAIQNKSTQAQSAMEAKAEQTIESIPEDYTELSGDVTELKADLAQLTTGNVSLDIIQNSYINNANGVITAYSGWDRTDYISLDKVKAFTVTKASSSMCNAFYDNNKEWISSFTTGTGTNEFYVPDNAKYMILSDSRSGMNNTSITVEYAPEFHNNNQDDTIAKLIAYNGYIDLKGSDWGVGYISTSGTKLGFVDCAGLSNNNGKRIVQRTIQYADKDIICSIAEGYRYAVQFFSSRDYEDFIAASSWQTGSYTIPKGSYYILGQVAETTDTTSISNYKENGLYDALIVGYADGEGTISIPEQFGFTKKITCWGNSLTMGATASYSNPWTKQFSELLSQDYTVINHGISGEGVQTIGGRQGGIPMITKNTFTIPATGTPVEIELTNMLDGSPTPLIASETAIATAGINPVFIAGISGTLSYSDSKYYFTRHNAGEAVTIDRPTVLITKAMRDERYNICILWTGENGQFDEDYQKLVNYESLIIDYSKNKNYLIISKSNNSYTGTFGINYSTAMIFRHGRKFINIVEYLSKYGLSDLNITPTEDDVTAMSNGLIPPSLKTDSTHLTTDAYGIVARLVYERGKELGYWD